MMVGEAEFGKYRLLRPIGIGAMGAIYEAIHSDLNKRVAIKRLNHSLVNNPEILERFRREGCAIARVKHPNVVDVTDVGFEEGIPFIVMEYLEGEALSAIVERERPAPVQRVVDILLPVISALISAHEQGVIHRDLKPDNLFVMRSPDGREIPKILDFGVSKITGDPQLATLTNGILGTPHYMSPEQACGSKDVDWRTDQYALGVIIYEWTTGVHPFQSDSLVELVTRLTEGQFEQPRKVRPEIPADVEQIILTAMHIDREKRFSSMRELAQHLLPFASPRAFAIWKPVFGKPSRLRIPFVKRNQVPDPFAASSKNSASRKEPDPFASPTQKTVLDDPFAVPERLPLRKGFKYGLAFLLLSVLAAGGLAFYWWGSPALFGGDLPKLTGPS